MNPQPENHDMAFSLAINAMVHGAYEKNIIRTRDEAIMCCLSAALGFAVETGRAGKELVAIELVQKILDDLKPAYETVIEDGHCNGAKGGYNRR